jgi:hypothetical protein
VTRRCRQLVIGLAAVTCACGPGPDAADDDGSPDATPADAVDPTLPPDVDGRLTINEFMASNALTIVDAHGVAHDWIELYNPTAHDIPLHGYSVTDDLGDPHKAVLPAGVIAPAGGHVLLWAAGSAAGGPTHLDFRLDRSGGEIGLARPDGSWIDRVRYGAQEVDVSAARAPDGSDLWRIEWHASPGESLIAGDGQPADLEDPAALPEEVPAAGDLTERILGYDVLVELAIELSAEAVAALEAEPRVYVPARLVFDGRSYGPVGVRLKGQNSFQPLSQKPALRIAIDRYVDGARLLGLKDLTLNNMVGDHSMMHERLAYLVARSAGIPASRSNHLLLTINGQAYGLYANVETVKRKMISRWFADDSGSLFEGTDVDFIERYIDRYEHESGPDDRTLLRRTAEALTLPSADAAIAAASLYVDLPAFQRFWAMCSVIGQFDSFPYSNPGDDYFVYADPSSGRLVFLPWGMDETFYSGSHDVLQIQSVLARRCMESPSCLGGYVDQVWDVLAATDALGLIAERDRVAAEIAPLVVQDLRKPYSDDVVAASQRNMWRFLTSRRTNLAAMLPPPSG